MDFMRQIDESHWLVGSNECVKNGKCPLYRLNTLSFALWLGVHSFLYLMVLIFFCLNDMCV